MLIVNFKAYRGANGQKARKIGRACEKAAQETGEEVMVAPQHTDLHRISDLGVKILGQHVDPVEQGSHTGHTTAEALTASGCAGTLVNHSERRIEPDKIRRAVQRAQENGLTTVVCAQDPDECERFSTFDPDYIAYEPPELIGGETSVSEAKPQLIERAVKKSEVDVLTGAGIKKTEDVEKSIELGCKGVLVASGVVKAQKPQKAATELCEGL